MSLEGTYLAICCVEGSCSVRMTVCFLRLWRYPVPCADGCIACGQDALPIWPGLIFDPSLEVTLSLLLTRLPEKSPTTLRGLF